MQRLKPNMHEGALALVLAVLLLYISGYGIARMSGRLVHTAGNRYTAVSRHDVLALYAYDPNNPYPTLEVVYYPLRLIESGVWPLVDRVSHPSS